MDGHIALQRVLDGGEVGVELSRHGLLADALVVGGEVVAGVAEGADPHLLVHTQRNVWRSQNKGMQDAQSPRHQTMTMMNVLQMSTRGCGCKHNTMYLHVCLQLDGNVCVCEEGHHA